MSEAVCMGELGAEEDRFLAKQMEDAAAARAEAYLKKVLRLNHRIDQKVRFRDQLQAYANRTTGEWLPLPGGGRVDSRSAAVERMIDIDREIDDDIDHLWNLKNEVWRVLDRIENQDIANILDDFYLKGCSTVQAAENAGYSRRYTDKLKRWGLLEVDRILREEHPMQGYVSPLA